MNKTTKIALLIIVILYVLSPVDLVPGPVDDGMLCLLCFAAAEFCDED